MTDYRGLVDEARAIPMPFEEPNELVLLRELADAVETLVTERDALRKQVDRILHPFGNVASR